MKIVCLVKEVPDSEAQISVRNGRIDESAIKFIVNPYDEFGIEEALKIKETTGGDHQVVILTFGTERARKVMESAMAIGADEGFIVVDDSAPYCDSHTTAKVLAKALEKIGFDLIFAGKQAIDDDNSQVAVRVAEFLGLPHTSVVNKFSLEGCKVKVERQVQGGQQVIEMPVPCVVTCQKGLNEPRYPSLKNIMAVKKKPRTTWTIADLGLTQNEIGKVGSLIEVINIEPPPEKSPGKILDDEVDDVAKELVRLLREEAKVI